VPQSLHAHRASLLLLDAASKQLDAPFGQFGQFGQAPSLTVQAGALILRESLVAAAS
jgi:hypothetical protein